MPSASLSPSSRGGSSVLASPSRGVRKIARLLAAGHEGGAVGEGRRPSSARELIVFLDAAAHLGRTASSCSALGVVHRRVHGRRSRLPDGLRISGIEDRGILEHRLPVVGAQPGVVVGAGDAVARVLDRALLGPGRVDGGKLAGLGSLRLADGRILEWRMNTPIRAGSRADMHVFVHSVSIENRSSRKEIDDFSSVTAAVVAAVDCRAAGRAHIPCGDVRRLAGRRTCPFGDTLNVRKYPFQQLAEAVCLSQRDGAADDRQVHRRRQSAGTFRHLPEWKQKQLVRYRWCQIWH